MSATTVPELLTLAPEEIGRRIVRLLEHDTTRREVSVESVTRTFGGNARRAWSFEISWISEGARHRTSAVMLSRVERGQVEADLADEYALLRALEGTGARAPVALALDPDGTLIGSPSIILVRIPGDASAVALLRSEDIPRSRTLVLQLAETAASLHTAELARSGLGSVLGAAEGRPARAYAAASLADWLEQFREAQMEPQPLLSALFGWLAEHLPDPPRLSVVHGDFRVGNFLYDENRLTGLLDWELAHLGDPVEDIAWAYRSFWSPERFVPFDAFVTHYEAAGGPAVSHSHLRYYRIFTEVKFATISLRAAKAFNDGTTRNLRLADRAATVSASLRPCLRWIAQERAEGRA